MKTKVHQKDTRANNNKYFALASPRSTTQTRKNEIEEWLTHARWPREIALDELPNLDDDADDKTGQGENTGKAVKSKEHPPATFRKIYKSHIERFYLMENILK
ncbi:Hypothetical protein NTJ_12152 [Nesidiocoris tenuis]|uniref:Uncharacterized protein n=1 Tax=Nesidiocoris tenuis TaxID=355587 RepID=A0ABN7B4J5_9HEMI|nr:Hypothetical protein NTJ_12152 [Nesidiocoris tenuis]